MSSSTEPGAAPAPSIAVRLRAWLLTPGGIAAIFIAGLAIRLALAPSEGFPTDMSAFKAWAGRLAERGPWDFYPRGSEEYFVDYPPGYLYVLWIVGLVARLLGDGGIADIWVKLPAIFADLGLAAVVMIGAGRIAPAALARRIPVRAVAAAAILLNPAVFFVSAVWGQADSVVALLVAGSLVLLGTGPVTFRREAVGMALLAVAFGTKPQAMFVIPMALLVLVWRHVHVPSAEATDPQSRRQLTRLGALRVAALGAAGVVAGFVLFLPFRLFPVAAFEFYSEASRTYRVTSVFAFNFWGVVGFWRPDSGADAVGFLGIPAVIWGIAAFVVLGGVVAHRAWTSLRAGVDEGRVLVFGAVAMTLVGFAVVTRIHERYLFLTVAIGAMLVAQRWLRRAFVVLSVLFAVNIYFPYVYYVEREGLSALQLGGLHDLLYGPDINGVRMKALSAVITVACLVIAWFGWRALGSVGEVSDREEEPPASAPALPPPRWTLDLHPVGRRGAAIALAVFAVALVSRVGALGHPPGMYFDEVYHARTGAEYLGGKEVFEYTHPPFAKQVMGAAIHRLSGFRTSDGGPLPSGVDGATFVPRPNGVAWARATDAGSNVQLGRIGDGCEAITRSTLAETDVRPDVLTVGEDAAFLAGTAGETPVLVRLAGGSEAWRATLPARALDVATVGDRAFVVTVAGEFVAVSEQGVPDTLAIGATGLDANDDEVWVMFGDEQRLAAWNAQADRQGVIDLDGPPRAVAAPDRVERVFVTVGDQVISYDAESRSPHVVLDGPADLLGTVPETTAVWLVDGTHVRVVEPHSGVVISTLTLGRAPDVLTSDAGGHQAIAIADDHLQCASGRPQFAWRLGSAIAGAAMVALVFLLAMRLFGSVAAGLLASLFLTVCGLAFTVARIAMNDSYMTAFILAAWFCVLSAIRHERRAPTIWWLAATGVASGFALASKWPGLYAIAGIGLLLLWDGSLRGDRSVWRVVGGFERSVGVLVLLLGVLPLGVYVLTYIPYFALGHGVGDFFELQRNMFTYHAGLDATHPFGSPWYGWPVGYRAVFLYLAGSGDSRSEIWTLPNLVVFWGGLVAMAALVRRMFSGRHVALAVVALGAAVQYLPWLAVSRVTFMYHYLPVVPWLALAMGWFGAVGLAGKRYQRGVIIGVASAAVAVFVFLYPILVGWEMPVSYLDLVRRLFFWVI